VVTAIDGQGPDVLGLSAARRLLRVLPAGRVDQLEALAIHDLFLRTGELDIGYLKLRTLDTYRAALDAAGFEIVWRKPSFFFAVQPRVVSSRRALRVMQEIWERFTCPLIERLPNLAGRSTYWTDKIIGAVMKEGPSFGMMICRRRT